MKQLTQLYVLTLPMLESNYFKDFLTRPAPLITGATSSFADNLVLVSALENEFIVYLYSSFENFLQSTETIGVDRQRLLKTPTSVIYE